jgi:hypothetical protein
VLNRVKAQSVADAITCDKAIFHQPRPGLRFRFASILKLSD